MAARPTPPNEPGTQLALFRGKQIRKTLHKDEWWFVISDVVAALSDSAQPNGYIKDMRRRDPDLNQGWGQISSPFWSKHLEGSSGSTAGSARKELETRTGRKVVTGENYLPAKTAVAKRLGLERK